MSVILHLEKFPISGCLGVECLQPFLNISRELCVSASSFSSPGSVKVPSRMCHRSVQTSYSKGTLLDGDTLASHHSQHVGSCSSLGSHCKGPHHGCLSHLGIQGSAVTAFCPLVAQRCGLCRQGLSSSVCQAVAGLIQASMTKVSQQCWKEWTSWCASKGVQKCHLCP